MSIKGSPYARFRRALRTGNLNVIRGAAAELPRIPLEDALTITALLREDRAQFEKAALRWLGRLCMETRDIAFEDAEMALAALRLIPHTAEWVSTEGAALAAGQPALQAPEHARLLGLDRPLLAERQAVGTNHADDLAVLVPGD